MDIKKLQEAFVHDYKCSEPRYTNYLIVELPDGRVSFIYMCEGHSTMLEAMRCHDMSEHMNNVRALTIDGRQLPVHNVIVKETRSIEFMEE
jgi:hypothetical protein